MSSADDQSFQAQITSIPGPNRANSNPFLTYAQINGLDIHYASQNAPIAYVGGVTRDQLVKLSQQSEIAWIYDASTPGDPLLNIPVPRKTQTC